MIALSSVLTNDFFNCIVNGMVELEVIDEPDRAAALLDPFRARLLSVLVEPGSATTVATTVGESRQKVNYHLRILEGHGLVRQVAERPRRGLTERVVVASARSYALSPAVLGDRAADPGRLDRLSASYLVAVAGRMVREVAGLVRRADEAGRTVATLTIDTEIRFASAADRAAFTGELADTVASMTRRYHHPTASGGRWHRLVVAAHPLLESPRSAPRADRGDHPHPTDPPTQEEPS